MAREMPTDTALGSSQVDEEGRGRARTRRGETLARTTRATTNNTTISSSSPSLSSPPNSDSDANLSPAPASSRIATSCNLDNAGDSNITVKADKTTDNTAATNH